MRYPLLWTRLYNAPLMIRQEKAEVIEQIFREKPGHGQSLTIEPSEFTRVHAAQAASSGVKFRENKGQPYATTESGIAVIPVLGTLIQRGDFFSSMSGMTSYDRLRLQLERALDDQEVRAVLLEVDSYGGEAAGMLDLADSIFASSERKPLWAHVNESAYSAAYGLASAAAQIYVAKSGGVGSIGTIAMHVDQSKYDEKQGKKYTFVYAGDHKKDFNPHEPLSDSARQSLQDEIDRINDLFVESVALKRGISSDKVRGTQAKLMSPGEAVENGFATGIATFAETVSKLEAELALRTTYSQPAGRFFNAPQQEVTMSEPKTPAGAQNAEKQYTQTDLDRAREEGRAAAAPAKSEAEVHAEASKAARERVQAILGCDEAKDRPASAKQVATTTDMSLEDAKKFLAGLPKEGKSGSFSALMSPLNPDVRAGGGEEGGDRPAPGANLNPFDVYAKRAKAAERARSQSTGIYDA